ncbi:MAG: DUF2071 domain-containing protein [Anaerolineae bacterium]|nr:DUF2071 domain-containing protein [Anaerolineae bacterium]
MTSPNKPPTLQRRQPRGIDVETALLNFAIVTFMVEPSALRRHVHPRFEPETIIAPDGTEKALISVVPFVDSDFHFVHLPQLKWRFGQTNYRAYVRDTQTDAHVVWFFGTVLDSWTNVVPRFLWRLPWHRARIEFDCVYDEQAGRFTRYQMSAASEWAAAELTLTDTGQSPHTLPGFDALGTGLSLLTHPMHGYYYRRDGKVGGYEIWHDWLQTTVGRAEVARFPLLARLNLVTEGDVSTLHSVLLQRRTDFTIYLPPHKVA